MFSPGYLHELLDVHYNPAAALSAMVITHANASTMLELAIAHIELACGGVTNAECAAHWRAIGDAVERWSESSGADTMLHDSWRFLDDWLECVWTDLRVQDEHIDAPIAYGVLFFRALWIAHDRHSSAMRASAEFTGKCPFPELA